MKKCLAFYLFFLSIIINSVFAQQVLINEFMSSNQTTLQDSDGDYPDWIELFNPGENIIDLEGYMISDDAQAPGKWVFPSVHMMPNSFMVIFASDKDRYDTTELHTNFKIKSAGEHLILCNPETLEIDHIQPVGLSVDVAFGRYPDGDENMMVLASPTPGHPNTPGVSVLNISKSAGLFNAPFKVGLSSANDDDVIYYTLDGSIPGLSSSIYSDSILIGFVDSIQNHFVNIPTTPDSMSDIFRTWSPPLGTVPKANVLRAIAYRNGMPTSRVVTNTYFVDTNFYIKYPYHIVSITTDSINLFGFDDGIYVPGAYFEPTGPDWSGNYFQKGGDWERPLHFEYFQDSGKRVLDMECGMRIHGKITRHAAQKSLRLYSRENGNSYFNYPFMLNTDQEIFKRILLRTSYADGSQTILKDAMLEDLVKDFNFEMLHYRPVIVFINGEFWGTQTIRERIDKYYLSLLYDIEADSIDMLENNMSVEEGSADDYLDMMDYIDNNDLSEDEHYEYIKTRMDIDNYIDYQIVEIYFQNMDWPGSNIRYWRERKPGAKWRWILFDLDNTCFDYAYNSLTYATSDQDTSWQNPAWSTYLFRSLLKNKNFEEQFLDRFALYLNTTFDTDTLLTHIDKFTNLYGQGIDLHIQRWNFPRSHAGWVGDINYVFNKFAKKRPCKMREFILEYFDLEEDEFGFYCDSAIDDNLNNEIILFPNPANMLVRIEIENWQADVAQLQVFNEMGQRVMALQLNGSNGQINELIDISGLNQGIYIFRVMGDQQYVISKFIKTSN